MKNIHIHYKISFLLAICLLAAMASSALAEKTPSGGYLSRASPQAAGDKDLTFGGFNQNGILQISNYNSVRAPRIALLPDGKILSVGGDYYYYIHRLFSNGELDNNFGISGTFSSTETFVKLLVQPDGKIIVVGSKEYIPDPINNYSFVVLRLLPSGVLDDTFGINGRSALPRVPGIARDAELQPDGKIVVVGQLQHASGGSSFLVARYLPNGDLDPSFSSSATAGMVGLGFGADTKENHPTTVAIDADGKIIVAGYVFCCSDSGNYDFALARLLPDGTEDPLFDGDGLLMHPGDGHDKLQDIALQPDGKIVAVGSTGGPADDDPIVIRYLEDGQKDPSFGGNGVVRLQTLETSAEGVAVGVDGKIWITLDGDGLILRRLNSDGTGDGTFSAQSTSVHWAGSLLLQPDGKVLVAARDGLKPFLLRFNPDGSLDQAGEVQTAFGPWYDRAYALDVQPDGKIVVVGESQTNGVNGVEVALARYKTNGSLDSSFGAGGQVISGLPLRDSGRSVAVASSGKIVVGGIREGAADDDFLIYRFHEDGSPDPSLYTSLDFGVGDDQVKEVLLQEIDGEQKIVLVGSSAITSWGKLGIGLARFHEDGSIDTSFGGHGTGKTQTAFGGVTSILVRGAALQPDGKLLVVGGYFGDFIAVRYNINGTLDTTFGGDGIVTVGGGGDDTAMAVGIFPSGLIVLAGKAGRDVGNQYGNDDFGLAFLYDDGSICTTCGLPFGGLLRTDFGRNVEARGIVLQPDGKILVAGKNVAYDSAGSPYYLARYRYKLFPINQRGYVLDTSFNGDGKLEVSITGFDFAWDIAFDPIFHILVAGYSYHGNDPDFSLVRLWNDYTPPPPDNFVYLPIVIDQ